MGVALAEITALFSWGNVQKGEGVKVLDIGCSNIYGGSPSEFAEFISTYGRTSTNRALREFCDLMSLGAMRHPIAGGLNGAWLGELLERIGCEYVAYDIFEGFMTTLFDLNRSAVPPIHRGYFDIVINCGTTEHVLNQLNSFRIIHDAVRTGGLMYHALPMVGYLDHGYFNYNPRLFTEIAQANDYEIVSLHYSDPQNAPQLTAKLVEPYLNRGICDAASIRAAWGSTSIPDAGLAISLRKHLDRPFRAPFETSTTIGGVSSVPFDIQKHDKKSGLASEAKAMMDNLENTSVESIIALLAEYRRENMLHAFPSRLERRLLSHFPIDDPDKHEERLRQLDQLDTKTIPLVRVPLDFTKATVALDGLESDLASIRDESVRYRTILYAYNQYVAAGRAVDFPLELEKEALQKAIADFPNDYDLVARLGKVVAALLARAPLS